MFCFSLSVSGLLYIQETEAFQRGLTGLEGARHIAYWNEVQGEWDGLHANHPLRIDKTSPVLLLRRQDAFYIRGLGGALRFVSKNMTFMCAPSGESRGIPNSARASCRLWAAMVTGRCCIK